LNGVQRSEQCRRSRGEQRGGGRGIGGSVPRGAGA